MLLYKGKNTSLRAANGAIEKFAKTEFHIELLVRGSIHHNELLVSLSSPADIYSFSLNTSDYVLSAEKSKNGLRESLAKRISHATRQYLC